MIKERTHTRREACKGVAWQCTYMEIIFLINKNLDLMYGKILKTNKVDEFAKREIEL